MSVELEQRLQAVQEQPVQKELTTNECNRLVAEAAANCSTEIEVRLALHTQEEGTWLSLIVQIRLILLYVRRCKRVRKGTLVASTEPATPGSRRLFNKG